MNIKQDILWRVYLTLLLLCCMGLMIAFQAFRIQVVEGKRWRALADSLTTFYQTIGAERGNIYSADGNLLATSVPYYELRMDVNSSAITDKVFYKELDSLSLCLSAHFRNRTPEAYRRMLLKARRDGQRYLLLARRISYPDLRKIKQFPLFRMGRYKGGLIALQKNERIKPFRMLAERTIGYIRGDHLRVGLESSYDAYLSGVSGKRLMQRIAAGVSAPINDENEIEPENGKDVISTMDVYIQDITQDALRRALVAHRADHGCAIVMETATGSIRALANLGRTGEGQYWEVYNYGVGESTEPGSTFKLASVIALLDDGLATVEDTVDISGGEFRYYDKVMTDAEEHGYGRVSLRKAFETSSNVGISRMVYRHYSEHPERFTGRLRNLRLDRATGVDIPGEPLPLIKEPGKKDWSGTTLPWMSVGYEVTMTPLQILTLYNAVANGGVMMKPRLVTGIQQYGRPVIEFKPEVLNERICSPSTLRVVRDLLEGVVERGTARNIHTGEYRIAGKTGTAQIAREKTGYEYEKIYQSGFAGYFPADSPAYTCIVVVNSPSAGVYYGSQVAAPVFREIADKIYANRMYARKPAAPVRDTTYVPFVKAGTVEDIREICDVLGVPFPLWRGTDPSGWVKPPAPAGTGVEPQEFRPVYGTVPDVTGLGLRDALFLLENAGLKVRITGEKKGRIRSQSIRPGTKPAKGETIVIELI